MCGGKRYGMVATILRRYALLDARALVERSFGSYLTSTVKSSSADSAVDSLAAKA